MEDIVASDGASLAQLQFFKARSRQAVKNAQGKVSKAQLAELRRSLTAALNEAELTYTRILTLTQGLPKIILNCSDNSGCRNNSVKRKVARYTLLTDNLRRLTFFVLRRDRTLLGKQMDAKLTAKTRRLHRATLLLSKQLPRRTDVCG